MRSLNVCFENGHAQIQWNPNLKNEMGLRFLFTLYSHYVDSGKYISKNLISLNVIKSISDKRP